MHFTSQYLTWPQIQRLLWPRQMLLFDFCCKSENSWNGHWHTDTNKRCLGHLLSLYLFPFSPFVSVDVFTVYQIFVSVFLTFENLNNHFIKVRVAYIFQSQICYLHTCYRVSFVFFPYDGLYRQKNTSINAWHHMVISVCFVAVKVDSPLVWRASVDSPGKKMKEI